MANTDTPGLASRGPGNPPPQALHDDEAFLQAVVATTPECIKIVAADGRLLQMNPAGLSMIEAGSWDSVFCANIIDLIAPEHRALWQEHHRRVCQGESLVWEFDIIGLNGTRRQMESHAAPISLTDGSIGQIAITRDITARKVVERDLQYANEALEGKIADRTRELETTLSRLQETERSFELLVGSVTDYAIFMLDLTGGIVSWNAGAQRIKGYMPAEIIGKNFSCFYTEEDRIAGLPAKGLRIAGRDGRVESEGWRVRKDGSRFWASVVIDAIHDDGRLVGFAKITRDITEKRAAEAKLRQAQKMEAVGQFTGGAAHDFNNLLSAILGSLQLLRRRLPNDQRMLALLDNAVLGAKRGASLTQRMLAFARRQELKHEAVDLTSMVVGVRKLLERSVGPSVNIETLFPRQLPRARSDVSQLETALLNLTLNSRDAMPDGGTITISAHDERIDGNHPTGLTPGHYVCLSVSDTGHGMDEATLSRVAEPFFTTKGIGKGTGLGLSMVDGLAAQSGGKLMIRSRQGHGTIVEIWLPVAGDDIIAAGEHAVAGSPVFDGASTPLVILAVDDDSLVLMNTINMLEELGHRVVDVASGAKALDVIETDASIELVISDQAMPGMTGVQLAEAIKARRPELPVILATGYAELPPGTPTVIHRLAKPFGLQELADAIAASER